MSQHPAGWYPDPSGQHRHRYWDGQRWTEHVDGAAAPVPPTTPTSPTAPAARTATPAPEDDRLDQEQIRTILGDAEVEPSGAGDGTLFGEPVLIVYQWVTDLADGLRYSYVSPAGAVVARSHEMLANPDPDDVSFTELMDHHNRGRSGSASGRVGRTSARSSPTTPSCSASRSATPPRTRSPGSSSSAGTPSRGSSGRARCRASTCCGCRAAQPNRCTPWRSWRRWPSTWPSAWFRLARVPSAGR
jgi:hypothetical protein